MDIRTWTTNASDGNATPISKIKHCRQLRTTWSLYLLDIATHIYNDNIIC